MHKDKFYDIVKPYTMTSKERVYALFDELERIRKDGIAGDLVECGVAAGGNILGMVTYLDEHGIDKKVWAFDTFTGMTTPEDVDVDLYGKRAKDILDSVLCRVPFEQFMRTLTRCAAYQNFVRIVPGDVCNMLLLEENLPQKIALLRLDTDWYQSTKIELEKLYPRLSQNGALIVDDYGHWRGSKKAVDEYFNGTVAIQKIDYTGILIIKQ